MSNNALVIFVLKIFAAMVFMCLSFVKSTTRLTQRFFGDMLAIVEKFMGDVEDLVQGKDGAHE